MKRTLVLVLTAINVGLFSFRATAAGTCRCVPDQLEGMLDTVEREFELEDGKVYEVKSKVSVHYDYAHRKFATVDLATGRKSIADYRMGIRANVYQSRCRAVQSSEPMRRMCFPEGANVVTSATVGSDLEVNIWKFVEPQNATVTTTATKDNCIPIIEDITVTDKGYLSLSSSLYTDLTLGIKDDRVFEIPKDCVIVGIPDVINREEPVSRKRRHLWSFGKIALE